MLDQGYASLIFTCVLLSATVMIENAEREELAHAKTSVAYLLTSNQRRLSGQQGYQFELETQKEVIESLQRLSDAIGRLSVLSLGAMEPALSTAVFHFTYHGGAYGSVSFFDVVSTSETVSSSPLGPFQNATTFVQGVEDKCVVSEQLGQLFVPCRGADLAQVFDRLEFFSVSFRATSVESRYADVLVKFDFQSHRSVVKGSVFVNICSGAQVEWSLVTRSALVVSVLLMGIFYRRDPSTFHSSFTLLCVSMLSVLTRSVVSIAMQWTTECGSSRAGWDVLSAISILSAFSVLFYETLHTSHFDSIRRTLLVVGPRVGAYVVGVLPIFVGYALCGMALFGGHELFATLGDSCLTLFCALFGDSLIDIFTVIDQHSSVAMQWIAKLYFVSFLVLFITNMLNIGLSVVQDAFAAAQRREVSQ